MRSSIGYLRNRQWTFVVNAPWRNSNPGWLPSRHWPKRQAMKIGQIAAG
jgi:hypothetical protein